jgi:Ca2+-transporting ATPase
MHDREAHARPIDEVLAGLQAHLERGLSQQEAQERLRKLGANELTEKPRPGFLALLWDQFNNYLVIILIIAALISLALGEWVDSIAIMCIVVLNAVVGVIQESKAEQALAALKKMAAPNAQVVRGASWFPATWSCWRRATMCPPTCVSSRPSTSRSRKPRSPGNRCRWRSTRRRCSTRRSRSATAGTRLS